MNVLKSNSNTNPFPKLKAQILDKADIGPLNENMHFKSHLRPCYLDTYDLPLRKLKTSDLLAFKEEAAEDWSLTSFLRGSLEHELDGDLNAAGLFQAISPDEMLSYATFSDDSLSAGKAGESDESVSQKVTHPSYKDLKKRLSRYKNMPFVVRLPTPPPIEPVRTTRRVTVTTLPKKSRSVCCGETKRCPQIPNPSPRGLVKLAKPPHAISVTKSTLQVDNVEIRKSYKPRDIYKNTNNIKAHPEGMLNRFPLDRVDPRSRHPNQSLNSWWTQMAEYRPSFTKPLRAIDMGKLAVTKVNNEKYNAIPAELHGVLGLYKNSNTEINRDNVFDDLPEENEEEELDDTDSEDYNAQNDVNNTEQSSRTNVKSTKNPNPKQSSIKLFICKHGQFCKKIFSRSITKNASTSDTRLKNNENLDSDSSSSSIIHTQSILRLRFRRRRVVEECNFAPKDNLRPKPNTSLDRFYFAVATSLNKLSRKFS